MVGIMREFLGLFVFIILSFIFSYCLYTISTFKIKEKNTIEPIIQTNLKFFDFLNIKILSIFSIYTIQLILLFIIAVIYNKYKVILFIEVIIFLIFIFFSLIYIHKTNFWTKDKGNK